MWIKTKILTKSTIVLLIKYWLLGYARMAWWLSAKKLELPSQVHILAGAVSIP